LRAVRFWNAFIIAARATALLELFDATIRFAAAHALRGGGEPTRARTRPRRSVDLYLRERSVDFSTILRSGMARVSRAAPAGMRVERLALWQRVEDVTRRAAGCEPPAAFRAGGC